MQVFKKFLLITYPILLAALIVLLFRGGYFGTATNPSAKDVAPDYRANPHYDEQMDFYSLYKDKPAIVFLGTSLTARVNWAEILNRPDVGNRGVNGDISAGILNRAKLIARQRPQICFIEGGINDIDAGISIEEVADNLLAAAEQLKAAGTMPVIMGAIPVTKAYEDNSRINTEVQKLNSILKAKADSSSILFFSLNAQLAPDGVLLPQFARIDGLHLTSAAYQVWQNAVERILKEKSL